MVGTTWLSGRARLAIWAGGGCQAAWWCCLCLLLVGMIDAKSMHFDFLTFEAETAYTTGRITKVVEHVEERTGRADDVRYEHEFSYELSGRELFGRAWSAQPFDKGSVVEVQYVVMSPRNARVLDTTTRPRSGMVLVLGAGAFFACIAWMLGRLTGWQNRVLEIERTLNARPGATWGFLPKLRLDRDGQITSGGSGWLLLAPIACIAVLTLATITVEV